MTLFPGSGLLKRIEAPERYFALRPEVGGVAEHVEQLLTSFAVEPRVVRKLLEHDDEAGLRARLLHQVGHAVVERVEVLAEMRRKEKGIGDALEDLLLGLRRRQIGVEKVLVGLARRLHQIVYPIGPDRLHDIW